MSLNIRQKKTLNLLFNANLACKVIFTFCIFRQNYDIPKFLYNKFNIFTGAAPIFESYKQILLAKMPASSSSSGQNEQHQSSHREDDIPLSDPESKSISSSNDKNKKQNSSKVGFCNTHYIIKNWIIHYITQKM